MLSLLLTLSTHAADIVGIAFAKIIAGSMILKLNPERKNLPFSQEKQNKTTDPVSSKDITPHSPSETRRSKNSCL